MSNLPPNSFNNTPGVQQLNSNMGPQVVNHSQNNQRPLNPVTFPVLKQDANSNSQHHVPAFTSYNNMNHYSQSASSSPAFNRPPTISPLPIINMQGSPVRLPPHSVMPPMADSGLPPPQNATLPRHLPNVNPSSLPYPPALVNHTQSQQFGQINAKTPSLIPSSQLNIHSNQNLINGPPLSAPQHMPVPPSSFQPSPYPMSTTAFSSHDNALMAGRPPPTSAVSSTNFTNNIAASMQKTEPIPNTMPIRPLGPTMSGPPSGLLPGPPSVPLRGSPALPGPPVPSGPLFHPPTAISSMQKPLGLNGPPSGISGPPMGPPRGSSLASMNQQMSGSPIRPIPPPGPSMGPPMGQQIKSPPIISQASVLPPGMQQTGPPTGNLQNRYPPMQQPINHQVPPLNTARYPDQYNTQGMTQKMGQMSVTKQGFDQLWGHQMVDLMQCRCILPEYPEDPPEIKLGHQFAESSNCSPEIFRCTVNKIPETNALLQKSRLPLGILIHPFKDLNHLPVIQCTSIVRCRACRTYINPFVYFVDSKRWKCNLCYRVNDLPEEFQYDPVSKSYGDPARRPEIKSATIEFIAPGEYMLRPPQPAVYLFLLDISQIARESGYLQVFCETLKSNLDQLPGDARTQVGFVCYDAHIHYYLMSEGLTRPKEMTVIDIDDVFLPSPECLLVNLRERRELIVELLSVLPKRHSNPGTPGSALGAALQAAHKLMAATGGRVTVFQTCLPNVGPGALLPREDPNARSSKEVSHLTPATDYYKRLSLDCSGSQIAVDMFLLNSQYSDLATLSGMSKFSAGTVYHIPLYKSTRTWQADQFRRMLTRYLTRKIGFEAVMRVRCTRGISIHTFHGNFFVRSTDLLSLPNVSPDAGFGMQLTIEESLSDLQQVCFQAALLYTSSKGERRIRVHTIALPIANSLTDVLHSADTHCIIGLLSKMAVDRCVSASLSESREALLNVAVDALSAHRLAQNLPAGVSSSSLHAPHSLRLLPLYLLALLKRKAFRTGTSTRLDDRVADMCDMKTLPLSQLLRAVYPDLYPIYNLSAHVHPQEPDAEEDNVPDPPRLDLTAERVNSTGAYLLDDGETMIIYVGHAVSPSYLSDTFGVTSFSQVPDEARSLPKVDSEGNTLLHMFIDKLNEERAYASNILLLRDNSPSRTLFTEKLVEDRVESAFSYYEFLENVKSQVK